MALMIPDEVQGFTTEGEGKFYRFLSAAAKPDNSTLFRVYVMATDHW